MTKENDRKLVLGYRISEHSSESDTSTIWNSANR